jgi:hypothetical protein
MTPFPRVVTIEPMIKRERRSPLAYLALIFAVTLLALAAVLVVCAGSIIEIGESITSRTT